MLSFHCIVSCSLSGKRNGRRATVVGGGVGGLVTATRLSQNGFSVSLLEKENTVGGRLSELRLNTDAGSFRYDTGPSLLLLPEVYRQTFSDIGVNIDDVLDLIRVEPNYKVFRGEQTLNIRSRVESMREELDNLEEGGMDAWAKYMKSAKAFFAGGFSSFVEKDGLDILKQADISSWVRMLIDGGNPLESHDTALRRLFRSELLIGAASFQDLYVGLSPYEAPAVFSLLGGLEAEQGVWYDARGRSIFLVIV